ncbi:MAG TPA: radical SAM protein [Archaeoglobus profundus]|nr:radical SAM protein [Archaeoglobus profundus]
MGKFKRIEAGSYYSYLTEGCKLCRRGAKLVMFITGLCPHSCYYCPISDERRGKDVIFANEREVKTIKDVIDELELMNAEGVAITGGEPLVKLNRVLEYTNFFSRRGLHIHLYTSIPANDKILRKLAEAGLDEIRFHPIDLKDPDRFEEPIKIAKKFGIEAGFEIPALRYSKEVVDVVNKCDAFLNVNELEFSSTNYEELIKRGYEPNDYYGEKKSDKIARMYSKVVKKFHYCTARFKDKAQMRRRFIRMAMNHPEFYQVSRDGTLICGYIEGTKEKIEKIKQFLISKGQDFVEVDGGLETSVEFVEKWKEFLKAEGLKISIIERFPTSKRTIVEVIPL